MSAVTPSAAQDFLSELTQDGSPVTWKQRTVTGTDLYGQPSVTFTATPITVIIRLMWPSDVKLVDAGFQLQLLSGDTYLRPGEAFCLWLRDVRPSHSKFPDCDRRGLDELAGLVVLYSW
jgi:hypothetical protein